MTDCLFCRIVAGEIPSTVVAESDSAFAFRDIDAKAPVHVLVVPRVHMADVADLVAEPELLVAVVDLAREVAEQECGGQFRLMFNTGPDAGQTVFHAHAHVLGGTRLGWTPA